MLEAAGASDEARGLCYGKDLLEVKPLALIHQIQGPIGFERIAAIAYGGEICGGVEVAPIGFLHDEGQGRIVLALKLVEKDALGAFAFR